MTLLPSDILFHWHKKWCQQLLEHLYALCILIKYFSGKSWCTFSHGIVLRYNLVFYFFFSCQYFFSRNNSHITEFFRMCNWFFFTKASQKCIKRRNWMKYLVSWITISRMKNWNIFHVTIIDIETMVKTIWPQKLYSARRSGI